MNLFQKAKILGEAGRYDSCGPKMCEVKIGSGLNGIYHARAEHKTCRLFKTLMSNACSFDCKYCSNANNCTKKKAKFEPKELATLFNHLNKKLGVHGLFLSSAVSGNPDRVTEEMIEAVEILRYKYNFNGYIHFKVLPGTSRHLIKHAAELSTRMSINIEAPSSSVMSELSSCKDFKIDILRRQAWISRMNLSGGQTTQLILNSLATDKEVLRMVRWEYDELKLKRVYYSSFRPVKGTPLENEPAEPLQRQNRLYNVDFLLRKYQFRIKEFHKIMIDGMLPKEDPKTALARLYFDKPVDINEASYEELIRIPGIGPKTAGKIKRTKITKYEQLHKLGGQIKKAMPFIIIDGKRQTMIKEF
ncbi:radical SAM protein [Candidatus Woesearchaeota archaeon]|nr:MAG: radical SAM protein [Candidatus Woesearchaeota archaeon]